MAGSANASSRKRGDLVQTIVSNRMVIAEVVKVVVANGVVLGYWLQRLGKKSNGQLFPSFSRWTHEIYSLHPPYDFLTFHAAADWLEENGFMAASIALRKAFPLRKE